MDFDAVYRFTPALSANASWQYTHQDTDLPFGSTLTIPRNVFTLGISIGYPDRHVTEAPQP
jgi:hypothetical protein